MIFFSCFSRGTQNRYSLYSDRQKAVSYQLTIPLVDDHKEHAVEVKIPATHS
jgi:hypothetical protein